MKIGVVGAFGKTGKHVIALAEKDPIFTKISPITRKKESIADLDVIVDFSTKEALLENLQFAKKLRSPIVVGTTGLQEKEKQALQQAAEIIPVFYSANFSLGMAATLYASKLISSLLPNFYCSIQETHHEHKKDAPSGSALHLKEVIEAVSSTRVIPIESFRKGEVIGEHTVFFSSEEEKVFVSHQALSREIFAKGALTAAKFLKLQKPGLYTMDNLFHMDRQ